MHPDLIDIAFLHIKTYGACMALGFILCWKLAERMSGRKDLGDLFMYLMISGVLGARIAYVIEHWKDEFAANPMSIVRIDQGGLVFYGGLILAVVVYFVWCKTKKVTFLETADIMCAVLPLGHAFGRIGCFFYGCCYGRISDSALAIRFPVHSPAWYEQVRDGLIAPSAKSSLPVLPTQLFEAGALLVLFAVAATLYVKFIKAKRSSPGLVAGAYLIMYALVRFPMEYLRGDPRAEVGFLSIAQTISLGVFLFGCAILAFSLYKGRATR